MRRILYLLFPTERVTGGIKMIFRHVETLGALNIEAAVWTNAAGAKHIPRWLHHQAPVLVEEPFRDDDVIVAPEDAPNALASIVNRPQRAVVFCQNHYTFAALGLNSVRRLTPHQLPRFIACSETVARCLASCLPSADIAVVPAFVDDQVFHSRSTAKDIDVSYMPRKRPLEAQAIRALSSSYVAGGDDLMWAPIEALHESLVAETLARSSSFLSLARLESLGLAALEAMASGCVVAGFTGIGGAEYATNENGFWVEEDDCEAAAESLVRALSLAKAGGPALARYREAASHTAKRWSYDRFRTALEAAWSTR